MIPINDTIEKINYEWSDYNINENIKHIELYLKKDLTDLIDEVNWDPNTNALVYIIQQFYEITPNPNAATTLYTDFNITSSKIITADNITNMRSDLNMVTNNVDVIDYDVKELTTRVDTLNASSEYMASSECLRLCFRVHTYAFISSAQKYRGKKVFSKNFYQQCSQKTL